MEFLSDLFTTGNEYADVAIGAVGVASAWVASKLEWWKTQSKPMKVATAVGAFITVALVLSFIGKVFG